MLNVANTARPEIYLTSLAINGACGQIARQAGTLIYPGNIDILDTKYQKLVTVEQTEGTRVRQRLAPQRVKDSDPGLAHSPDHLLQSLLAFLFSSSLA